MKNLILISCYFIAFSFCSSVLGQQFSIKGKVINQHDKSLEFADILLFENDSLLIDQAYTDSLGLFSMKIDAGTYLLKIKQFGVEFYSQEIEINQDKDLGLIKIQDATTLEGTTITAKKKLIEQKVDRLVYNIENSIASQGMSALDALRNTPMVSVLNDNISIVGKGNLTVMVNDRMLNLSGSELTNYLQSLRSDDIAKIEIITTPPSKYEAQGNSGIINIILKKNPNLGWSESVNSSYQRNSYNGFRTGGTLNYQSNKISSSLKINQGDINYKLHNSRNLIGKETAIYTNEERHDNPKIFNVNYNLDVKINKNQNTGFIYSYSKMNYDMDTKGISRYQTHSIIDSTLYTNQKQHWTTPTHTLNAYYDIKLDSIGKMLNFTANFLNNSPKKINDFNTQNELNNNETLIQNNSKMKYSIFSMQADFTLPYKWSNIETGAKYTLLDNKSDVGYYEFDGVDFILNPTNSNIFQYKENNYAAYVSFQKDFNEKWSTKAGLRYEYTSLVGFTPNDENSRLKKNYGKLFPTAYISYKPTTNHSFSINYSKRINRPNFQSLNPFRWYTNPYMYYTGNPKLQPSFNDNIELNYSYKGKLTFGLYNQYSQNNLSNIAHFSDGIYSNVVENSYDQNRTGFNIGYYNTFFKIWETSVNANASYTTTKPTISELEKLKVYSMSYSFYNTITLNKDKTWFLMLNFWHTLPFTYANIKLQDQLEFSPGIKASFFDKKIQANFVINDVFKTIKNKGYSYNGDYRSEFNQYNDYRGFKLSLTYNFGNNKVKENNKKVNFEEQNRAN